MVAGNDQLLGDVSVHFQPVAEVPQKEQVVELLRDLCVFVVWEGVLAADTMFMHINEWPKPSTFKPTIKNQQQHNVYKKEKCITEIVFL